MFKKAEVCVLLLNQSHRGIPKHIVLYMEYYGYSKLSSNGCDLLSNNLLEVWDPGVDFQSRRYNQREIDGTEGVTYCTASAPASNSSKSRSGIVESRRDRAYV